MQKLICGVCLVLLLAGNAMAADKTSPLKSEKEKLSYAMGLDLASTSRAWARILISKCCRRAWKMPIREKSH